MVNSASQIECCLSALAASGEAPDEVLVVDDGSTDDSVAVARRFAFTTVSHAPGAGSFRARNIGASVAQGDILLFLDADVRVPPGAIARVRRRFEEDPELVAVFGSYDNRPSCVNLVSQYRNLLHAFIHQTSRRDARTFWTGCGAIRRELFLESGGFSTAERFFQDVELGVRISRSHRKILLDSSLQVTHLKRWTLAEMVRTDVFHRAAIWTQIILRERSMPNDLNLRIGQRLSVILVYLMLFWPCIAAGAPFKIALATFPGLFLTYLLLNVPFFRFLARARGAGFAARSAGPHVIYHLCCGIGFCLGTFRHFRGRISSLPSNC